MSNFTEFDYLLNSFEQASQADKPAEHGYGDKRRALFAYVRKLEVAALAQQATGEPVAMTDKQIESTAIRTMGTQPGPLGIAFVKAIIAARDAQWSALARRSGEGA